MHQYFIGLKLLFFDDPDAAPPPPPSSPPQNVVSDSDFPGQTIIIGPEFDYL